MKNCKHCHKNYDETNVNISNPIPDYMCAYCGTQLTEEEVQTLIAEFNNSQQNEL